jgi:hypothetical protein
MRNQDPKAFPDPEDGRAKVDGFGKPGPASRRDTGAAPPVSPVPGAAAVKPDGGQRKPDQTAPGRPGRHAAAPTPGGKRERRPKRHKRRLRGKSHQVLANHAATFCELLRNDPVLLALIRSSPRNFRADLLGLIRAQFPLRRGRPPDPQLDEAYRLITQGKSVPQVARQQFPDWSRKDPVW